MTAAAAPLVIDDATPQDEAAIRHLLSRPMPGDIAFASPREPDHQLATTIEGDRHQEIVARQGDEGRVVAYASRSVRSVWVNARPTRVGYLSALRLTPDIHASIRGLKHGFDRLNSFRLSDEADYDITSIMASNRRARRLLEAGLPHLPTYTPLGRLATLILRVRRRIERSTKISHASRDDITDVVGCLQRDGCHWQYRPVWTSADLLSQSRCRCLDIGDFLMFRDEGRVRACLAVWDQRTFKQISIAGYTGWMSRCRVVVNMLSGLTGRPRLPGPGQSLALGYVSHLAVDPAHPIDAAAMLDAAFQLARARGLTYLALGMPEEHALTSALKRRFRPWVITSIIYAVHYGDAPNLDSRPAWPEVASL